MDYRYEYDDPYKILAQLIMGYYQPAEVIRILDDDEFLLTLIKKEIRQADIGGWFLDCIIEDILAKKKRMEYMRELDRLGEYYASRLDKKRLRKELRRSLKEAGISLIDEGERFVSEYDL